MWSCKITVYYSGTKIWNNIQFNGLSLLGVSMQSIKYIHIFIYIYTYTYSKYLQVHYTTTNRSISLLLLNISQNFSYMKLTFFISFELWAIRHFQIPFITHSYYHELTEIQGKYIRTLLFGLYTYTAADCNRRDVVKPKAQGL